MIIAFAGDVAQIPKGWLLCDGQEVGRPQYPSLFKAISVNWGVGNNSSTFNLPDLRGQFLRGSANNATFDPGLNDRTENGNGLKNAPGSKQEDAFQGHNHLVNIRIANATNSGGGTSVPDANGAYYSWGITANTCNDGVNSTVDNPVRIAPETRPRNSYVNYIIKY
jgi:microcystin-dependent protein